MEDIRELIKEYCENEGLNYRANYAGRGMFGRNCVAVDCDSPLETLSRIFAYLVDNGDLGGHDVMMALGEPKSDSMGMGSVLYFPELKSNQVEE